MTAGGSPVRGGLSSWRILVMVTAAAAPMSSIMGNLPLALAMGGGAGLLVAIALTTVVLLCFSVGYAAMSRKVVGTGTLHVYVMRGLGRPAGVGAALLAVLSYTSLAIGLAGAFGYFTSLVFATVGVHVHWLLCAGLGIAITGLLGYRSVDLSARILAVLLVAELLVVVIYDIAVLASRGLEALPTAALAPGSVTFDGLGLGLLFAFISFAGFESAALYGEEATDPTRSIPRATFLAVGLMGLFYLVTSWITMGAIGLDQAESTAQNELGNLLFGLTSQYASPLVSQAMALLLCTSLLASMLAMHNAASRYLLTLGRERLLPTALGRLHPRHYSPAVASAVQTVLAAVVIASFAATGLDPYLNLATSLIALSTLGILTLQAFAAVAIVVHFQRRSTRGRWRIRLAAAISAVGLLCATALLCANYRTLTGTGSPVIDALPVLVGVAVIGGAGYGLWLRSHRADLYAGLSEAAPSASVPGLSPVRPALPSDSGDIQSHRPPPTKGVPTGPTL
ncbi:APC family permease [Streptomyces chartreusis]